jgi:hypothetical protein
MPPPPRGQSLETEECGGAVRQLVRPHRQHTATGVEGLCVLMIHPECHSGGFGPVDTENCPRFPYGSRLCPTAFFDPAMLTQGMLS